MLVLLALLSTASPLAVESLGPAPPSQPRRVVSLAPSLTEIVFALGQGDRVVGVTRYDDFPPEVTKLPKVGGFVDADPEAVMALKPDLVLAVPNPGGRTRLDVLARLGVSVLVVPAQTLTNSWEAINVVGAALGQSARARTVADALRRDLDILTQTMARAHPGPPQRVLIVVGRRPLVGVGTGTFLDALLERARGRNVLRQGGPYPVFDLEAVATLHPDVILDLATDTAESATQFWQQPLADTARRQARLVRLEGSALLRPGPRLVEALRRIAGALWPTSAP